MSEERITPPEGEEPEVTEARRHRLDEELQELGNQLTTVTRAILESPEAKEVGAQIQRGLESLEQAVSRLAGQARETKVAQRVETGVSEAAETVRERRMVDTAAESIARALHAVNKALGQVAEKAQAHAEQAPAEPQRIHVAEPEPGPEE